MRALLPLLLLLAGCAAPAPTAPTGAPEPEPPAPGPEERVLLEQEFVARTGESPTVEVQVPPGASLVLRVVLDTGAATRLEFHGLGACDGFAPVSGLSSAVIVRSGSAMEQECGPVEAGAQPLSWSADGAMQGWLTVRARIA